MATLMHYEGEPPSTDWEQVHDLISEALAHLEEALVHLSDEVDASIDSTGQSSQDRPGGPRRSGQMPQWLVDKYRDRPALGLPDEHRQELTSNGVPVAWIERQRRSE